MNGPLELVSALTVVVAGALGLLVARRARRGPFPLGRPLGLVMVSVVCWALAGLALTRATDDASARLALAALLASSGPLVAGSLWHSVVFAGHGALLTRRVGVLLAIEPAVMGLLAVTSGRHGWLLAGVHLRPDGGTEVTFGPAFWPLAVLSYVAVVLGAVLLVRAIRRAVSGQRWQYSLPLAALVLPVAASVVTVSRAMHHPFVDLTSPVLLVTAGMWLWVERFAIELHSAPVSTAQVLRALGDAVLVVDAAGRVVQANPAAQEMLGPAGSGLVERVEGAPWQTLLPAEHREAIRSGRPIVSATGRVLDVRVTDVTDGDVRLATVAVIRDVTDIERLRGELAEQAIRDGLTGLHNRRHLDHVLEPMIASAASRDLPLTAVMVDLDHFKVVNDVHGHAVGDQVLVAVARELTGSVREGDVLVRFGGEEFLALLPGARAADVALRMEALRARCAALELDAETGPVRVTVSCGVSERRVGDTADSLLRRADDALYAAKAAGRDRVVVVPR